MNLTRHSTFLAVALLLIAGCAADSFHEPEPPENDVKVRLALDQSGLSIIDTAEVDGDAAPSAAHAETVRFYFQPTDGSEPLDGELADGRFLRSEYDLEGQLDPQNVLSDVALYDLQLPAVPGRIQLEDDEGTSLGEVYFDPEAPVTHQQELMNQDDILNPPVRIVSHGDASRKMGILFLPEGYTEAEMGQFRQHVDAVVRGLSNYSGYSQYWTGFNIWRQDIRSRSNVIGSNASPNDTAFETASGVSGVERCVFFTNTRGQQAARRLSRNVGAEITVVLVNSAVHGGCAGGGLVVQARPRNVVDVLAHELGHALFGLADEYETPRPGGYCSTGPNVSDSPTRLPWGDMVNTSTLPTPSSARSSTIGAFEGAGYCSSGRYRPTHNCLMRTLGVGFCPVCEREVQRTMARFDLGVDNTSQPSNSGSTGGSSGGSTGSSNHQISVPRGLNPDFAEVDEPEIALSWQSASGASYYNFTVQIQENGSWRPYAEQQVNTTRVRVSLNRPGDFRWRVSACHSGACEDSLWARFTYATNSTNTTNQGTNDPPSTGTPSRPSHSSPQHQSVVSSNQTRLEWRAASGATHYNLQVQVYDEGRQRWSVGLEQNNVSATRQSIGALTNQTWYAWFVQACNSSGCSAWTEPTTFRVQY